MSEKYVLSRRVAARLGVKTDTLAKMRRQGRGPAGWFHVSATAVVYPEAEVERFLEERRAAPIPAIRVSFPAGNRNGTVSS